MRVAPINLQTVLATRRLSGLRTGIQSLSRADSGWSSQVEVEFSEAARKMQQTEELVEAAWSRLERQPGVRWEVVEEARRKLREGRYEQEGSIRTAAARILASLPAC